jgi:hypothetical protein
MQTNLEITWRPFREEVLCGVPDVSEFVQKIDEKKNRLRVIEIKMSKKCRKNVKKCRKNDEKIVFLSLKFRETTFKLT